MHALGDVVQCDGQHHHRRALELALRPLDLPALGVQVRDDVVEQQQKRMPTQKPRNAGRNESFPIADDCLMAGISRLHTEAATITPAAKPVSERCTASLSDFFMKNTHAAPSDVPRNGIKMP